jgi:hypothetical protein
MLSFEMSAMDVVLLIAILVLFLLFITRRRNQSAAEPRLNMDEQGKPLEERQIEETAAEKLLKKQSAEGFQKCIHQFGYLRSMPKNAPIPDECFGCPKVLRCMFPNQQDRVQVLQ